MSGYVLDACALIALLNGEEGKEVMATAFASNEPLRMSAFNLLEVAYDAVRRQGRSEAAEEVLHLVKELEIDIAWSITPNQLLEAAKLKAAARLSLADCVALALTIDTGARLLTADHHEFDAYERAGLDVFAWIR